LSSQWLSSIRQSESPEEGSDRFINDLKWIAHIDEECALDPEEMDRLANFCQKTMDIQSLSNGHLADLLHSECVKEQIDAGHIKQMPKIFLKKNLFVEQPLQYQLVCYDLDRLQAITKKLQKSPDVIQMIIISSDIFTEKKESIKETASVNAENISDLGHAAGLHFDPSSKRFYFYDSNSEVSDCLKKDDESSGSLWTESSLDMAKALWFFFDGRENYGQVFCQVVRKCMIIANESTIATFLDDQDDWLENFDDGKVQDAIADNCLLNLVMHAMPKELREHVWEKILSSVRQRWKRITGRELRGLDQERCDFLYGCSIGKSLDVALGVFSEVTKEEVEGQMIFLLEQCEFDLRGETKTPQEQKILEGLHQFLHNHQTCFANDSSQ
jgi:hypothetical protein